MPSKLELRRNKEKQSRDSLDDWYIISILTKGTCLKASDIRLYPEMIECKRMILKIHRLIELQKNEEI